MKFLPLLAKIMKISLIFLMFLVGCTVAPKGTYYEIKVSQEVGVKEQLKNIKDLVKKHLSTWSCVNRGSDTGFYFNCKKISLNVGLQKNTDIVSGSFNENNVFVIRSSRWYYGVLPGEIISTKATIKSVLKICNGLKVKYGYECLELP
jgi:hypothetical protein